MNTTCAIYVRTATLDREELLEHRTQLDQCKKFVRDNGYELHKVYQDIASGILLSHSALQDLLNDVSEGKFNTIVMTNHTRFVRDSCLLNLIQKFLSDNNVKVLTLN